MTATLDDLLIELKEIKHILGFKYKDMAIDEIKQPKLKEIQNKLKAE